MRKSVGRYSKYLRPLTIGIDLFVLNSLAWYLTILSSNLSSYLFISIAWIVIAYNTDYYEVYRFTKYRTILLKILKQFVALFIVTFAYIGLFYKDVPQQATWLFLITSMLVISLVKFSVFILLKRYRAVYKGNLRQVFVLGDQELANDLMLFFQKNSDYGYNLVGSMPRIETQADFEIFTANIIDSKIDEIYCELDSISQEAVANVVHFTDNNLLKLKFLPRKNDMLIGAQVYEYYGTIPVYSYRHIPLEKRSNYLIKRAFDIVFSLIVIVFVLSWLIPILALLIKLESKGPVFFKQKRNGLDYKHFYCYKFRSMHINPIADLEQVSKEDPRITRVGSFMRKTSIDELPQFFNVLIGDMSVVGPRPHMVSHTEMYAKSINKFMVRHFIKPGITGLAQTSGYRGEVETQRDIINRVKYDIFYLENWSLFLDIRIIISTIMNAIKGEEKAY